MRALLTSLMLAAVVLSGCASPADAPEPDAEPVVPPVTPPIGTIVHGADDALDLVGNLSLPQGIMALTGFDNFEPTLGVTSAGNLFMSATDGSVASDYVSIVRSQDGGASWHSITPKLAGAVSTPPISTDPYVHVDQDTDRIFNLDMEGLNCNYIQWSDDEGETFTGHALGCGQPPVLDHPTLFTGTPRLVPTVGYDNVVYLCVNRIADSACSTSYDGGLTFNPFRTVFGLPENEGGGAGCGGLHGHGTTGPDGRAYLGKMHCGTPMIAVSDDDGLTWSTHKIAPDHTSTRHDVELAADSAGNVYAMWVDSDWDPYFAVSTDYGRSWSEPHAVAAPGIQSAVFPAIAAGDEGKIAMIYYGTPKDIVNEGDDDANWTAFIVTVPDALAAQPILASAALHADADPIAMGPCDDDNRCSGVGDFIDIVIDMEGRPWAALFDSYAPDDGPTGGAIGTLSQGFPLRGDADALPVLSLG